LNVVILAAVLANFSIEDQWAEALNKLWKYKKDSQKWKITFITIFAVNRFQSTHVIFLTHINAVIQSVLQHIKKNKHFWYRFPPYYLKHFWCTTPCSLVDRHEQLGRTSCFQVREKLPWKWWQQVPLKHWYLDTKPCGVPS